jgi:hypothetical protein
MTLPGFTAETSLYRTSLPYRLMGASVQADGVVPQQPIGLSCGSCHKDATGACLRNCTYCFYTIEGYECFNLPPTPCDPSACDCINQLFPQCVTDWDGTTMINVCDCNSNMPNCGPCQQFPFVGQKKICNCG